MSLDKTFILFEVLRCNVTTYVCLYTVTLCVCIHSNLPSYFVALCQMCHDFMYTRSCMYMYVIFEETVISVLLLTPAPDELLICVK